MPDKELKIMVLWILTKIRRLRMNKVKISIKTYKIEYKTNYIDEEYIN